MNSQLISFIIPCYRSESTIESVICEINTSVQRLKDFRHEIILVNDCSPDSTWSMICSIVKTYPHIRGYNLSKNFGQHSAIMAGLNVCHGDIIVCLDDDGQTPADEVGKLLAELEKGADAVYARYPVKQCSLFRRFGSNMNDWMANVMLGKPKGLVLTSYFAVRRFVVDEIIKSTSPNPFAPALVLRATQNIVNVDVSHRARKIGSTGYTFSKLFDLWMTGFLAGSIQPLRLGTGIGVFFALLGFLYGFYTILNKLFNPELPPIGFPALMSVVTFMSGMLMVMLGLVAEYIGRIYMSQNKNPQFVIRDVAIHDEPIN